LRIWGSPCSKVDTLKNALKSTFEVYNLASIRQDLVFIGGEIMVHPHTSDKSTTDNPPKLLDQVRDKLRVKHYSIRTEQTYLDWIKRYIYFHGKRHPKDMGAREIEAFLTHLAVVGKVSASTCGFNRSMQHTRICVSRRRSVANESKTTDILHGKPAISDVGPLAKR
jgi:hypothetical protein